MGHPLSLTLNHSTPMTSSQPARQTKIKDLFPQDNENNSTCTDWTPQASGAKREISTLTDGLHGQADMFQTSLIASQCTRSGLNQVGYQFQASHGQFQVQETTYGQARNKEDQGNRSFTNQLEGSDIQFAVYSPQGKESIHLASTGRTTDKIHVAVTSRPTPFTGHSPLPPELTVSSTPTLSKSMLEQMAVRNEYYTGYLFLTQERIEKAEKEKGNLKPTDPIVFRHDTNLKIDLPFAPGTQCEGFVYAGQLNLSGMHDSQARNDFVKDNYIRCPNTMLLRETDQNPTSKTTVPAETSSAEEVRYNPVDVILTGTTRREKCLKFTEQLYGDVAHLSAADRRDPGPYGNTRVVAYANNKFSPQGDLTTMSTTTKHDIITKKFTVCPSTFPQTQSSSGEYKNTPAIITGTTHPSACDALHMREMHAYVDDCAKKKAKAKTEAEAMQEMRKEMFHEPIPLLKLPAPNPFKKVYP